MTKSVICRFIKKKKKKIKEPRYTDDREVEVKITAIRGNIFKWLGEILNWQGNVCGTTTWKSSIPKWYTVWFNYRNNMKWKQIKNIICDCS